MAVRGGLLPERYAGPQPIGRGGMGSIYRATDTTLGRAVAVKVLDDRYAEDENVRARFTREALAAARLSGYPNIVTIYDVGEYQERPYIVMEYLGGGSLAERIRSAPVETRQALDWLEQAAAALDAAHREGVVHRDVKPANLLLDRRGDVHVADFGIASAAGLGSLTQTGTVLGTASYLSPEQARGERTTPASDLYSLAVVAFELFTGRRPFEADSVAAEAAAHVTGDLPSVRDVDPGAPYELDPVFAKALAKDPSRRFTSGAEFVAALRAALDGAAGTTQVVGAPPPPPPTVPLRPRPAPQRGGGWLLPALLGALLAAGIALGIVFATRAPSSSKPQPVRVTTLVQRVTQPSQTVVSTVVTTAPAPTTTQAQDTGGSSGVGGDPVQENNRAYALMNEGNYSGALPLLRDAASQLQGQGNLAEAYTDYNLGYTLMQLGSCSEARDWLEASRRLQPQRKEVKDALKQAKHC